MESSQAKIETVCYLATNAGSETIESAANQLRDKKPTANILQGIAKQMRASGLDAESAADYSRTAFAVALNREKAIEKFGSELGEKLLFDSDGLQMASSSACSNYHARLFILEGEKSVIDLTAGIGGDTIAFAQAGLNMIAFESDPIREIFLCANLGRLGLSGSVDVKCADWSTVDLPNNSALYLDPPRRSSNSIWGGIDVATEMIAAALKTNPSTLIVKLSPAFDWAKLPKRPSRVEYISERGICKESLAVFSTPRGDETTIVSAVILPSMQRLVVSGSAPETSVAYPMARHYIYEPDPAVIRSGGLSTIAHELGLNRIDYASSFLTWSEFAQNSFLKGYAIIDVLAYDPKLIQSRLNQIGCTSLVVKTRDVNFDPETIREQFRLRKSGKKNECVVALVPNGKKVLALFLDPLPKSA